MHFTVGRGYFIGRIALRASQHRFLGAIWSNRNSSSLYEIQFKQILVSYELDPRILPFAELEYLHVSVKDSTGFANLLGSGAIISVEHPNFDIGLHEVLNAFLDVVLQQVFQGCDF